MAVVSIIVPAYNAEPFLQNCLDSVRQQTYHNWELILVDDGSTDTTADIGIQNASIDKRIKYFRKNNSGVSSTRNFGLDQATGEYIMFLDSDDFCHPKLLELLLEGIYNESELSVCSHKCITKLPKEFQILSDVNITSLTEISEIYLALYNIKALHNPWSKLYQKSIIERFRIRFNENLALGEDLCFNLEYLDKIRSATIIKTPLYYYRHTANSLSKDIRIDYVDIQLYLIEKKMAFVEKYNIPFNFEGCALGIVRDIVLNILKSNATYQDKKICFKVVRQHRITNLCKFSANVKDTLSILILKYIPINLIVAIFK